MTEREKIDFIIEKNFKEVDFDKIDQLAIGLWHLTDHSGEIFIRLVGDKAQIAFDIDFKIISEVVDFTE
ncbi:hypothetical protein [Enterococcus sp. DIV1420a]|uniref:hypothetical protein n=1 Tax=Enterococcus sp. DIV1420a TaxID=2774672 RepID=UPI0036D617FB